MAHVVILFGRYFRMFVRYRFFGPAHKIQRNRRIGLFVALFMKSKEYEKVGRYHPKSCL
jgi:hypothetical protein